MEKTPAENPAAQPTPAPGLIGPSSLFQPGGQLNLVHPIRVASTGSEPGFWKSIVLDVLVVAFAAMFGYFFARYLDGGFSLWLILVALLSWSALSVLQGFLQKNTVRRFLVICLESLTLAAFFYAYAWQALALATALALIALWWGYVSVRRELRNTVEIRFFTASSKIVGKVVTAAALFMVVMYASLSSNSGNFFASQDSFNVFFNAAGRFVNNFYPTVPITGSTNDFAQAVARMQLQGNSVFESLPSSSQSMVITDSANQLMATLSNATSVSAAPVIATEPTSNAFYAYLSGVFAKLQDHFNGLFVGVWGFLLFLILRSIGIIVVWVGQFVSLILYELLLATGFIKINEQAATKETIEYS